MPDNQSKPPVWKVQEAEHIAPGPPRTHFKTSSERAARTYITTNHPRGSEAVLLHPDGFKETYEPGRLNEDGSDAEEWAEYDKEMFE